MNMFLCGTSCTKENSRLLANTPTLLLNGNRFTVIYQAKHVKIVAEITKNVQRNFAKRAQLIPA